MIAFFVNGKSTYFLLACLASEAVGRLALFSWALNYEYGVFMHLFWSVIYCYCLMFYWLGIDRITIKIKLTIALTIILIFYQLVMAWDCKWSEGNATFLYGSYKYIIVFIHCCIVSTFIERGNIINRLDEFTINFRGFFGANGYFNVYWYNGTNSKNKIGEKK